MSQKFNQRQIHIRLETIACRQSATRVKSALFSLNLSQKVHNGCSECHRGQLAIWEAMRRGIELQHCEGKAALHFGQNAYSISTITQVAAWREGFGKISSYTSPSTLYLFHSDCDNNSAQKRCCIRQDHSQPADNVITATNALQLQLKIIFTFRKILS